MSSLLTDLLLKFEGLTEDEIFEQGRRIYSDIYLQGETRGLLRDFRGERIVFYEDRYGHAFRTSANRAMTAYSKAVVAVSRIERIHWIRAVLTGEIPEVECWNIRPKEGRVHPPDRAFILWNPGYIVWLRPNKDCSAWVFSSAYPVPPAELARYTAGGSKQCRVEIKPPRD